MRMRLFRFIRGTRRHKLPYGPAKSGKDLLAHFTVQPENELLQGVMHVLRGLEEMAKLNAAVPELGDSERALYVGSMSMSIEAQERILDLVEKAKSAETRPHIPVTTPV